jgi:hypothetical protein
MAILPPPILAQMPAPPAMSDDVKTHPDPVPGGR